MKNLSRKEIELHRMCWGKRVWNKKDAESANKVLRQRIYRCPNCKLYHLTTKPKQ